MSDLARIEAKLDLIIKSLGLDGSHTKLEMERKVPGIVIKMLTNIQMKAKKE